MHVKKHRGTIYGASLSKQEVKAIQIEVNKQLAEASARLEYDTDSMVLYTLATEFGFGKKRLRRFYKALKVGHDQLTQHYLDDDFPFLARTQLEHMGIDLDKWVEEINNECDGVV